MPVILSPEAYERWLNPQTSPDELQQLLRPYAGDDLQLVAVNPWVNDAKHDDPRCAEGRRQQAVGYGSRLSPTCGGSSRETCLRRCVRATALGSAGDHHHSLFSEPGERPLQIIRQNKLSLGIVRNGPRFLTRPGKIQEKKLAVACV